MATGEGLPTHLALDMATYLYSFEFVEPRSRKRNAAARTYAAGVPGVDWIGHHARQGDALLADAGWHCTWCFRHLDDFYAKIDAWDEYRVRRVDAATLRARVCRGDEVPVVENFFPRNNT